MTCTTLASDVRNSSVLLQPSRVNDIRSVIFRRWLLGNVGYPQYSPPSDQSCGCGVCRLCDFNPFPSPESEQGDQEETLSDATPFFASGESVSAFSEEDEMEEEADAPAPAQEPHLASFRGCNCCGCSARMDEVGDRVCWCESCNDGCFLIVDHCTKCDCLEEYDSYSGERVCFHDSCRQSGCVHRHFIGVRWGKEFTKP
jgi:hypothetical protein